MAPYAVTSRGALRRLVKGAAAIALAGSFGFPVAAASAPAEDAGEAMLTAGEGSRRLAKGGSTTQFSIRLPVGASCPGDTANDGYRVQSFMAPATVVASTIEFDGLGPRPNAYGDWATFRQPLYDLATRPLDAGFTAVATAPGQPGPIINLPVFSFAVYAPGELPPGSYRLGIVCTLSNQPVRFWDTEIEVRAAPDDKPAQVSWRVTGDSQAAEPAERGSRTGLLAGALAIVAVLTVYSRQRLRSRTSSESLEDR